MKTHGKLTLLVIVLLIVNIATVYSVLRVRAGQETGQVPLKTYYYEGETGVNGRIDFTHEVTENCIAGMLVAIQGTNNAWYTSTFMKADDGKLVGAGNLAFGNQSATGGFECDSRYEDRCRGWRLRPFRVLIFSRC
jgi:hypothetical protein